MLAERKRCLICNIIGFCLIIFGCLYSFFSEDICNKLMEHHLVLRPDSQTYNLWKSPPLKLTLDIYIFNWTNPEDFQDLSIKPKFEELGPYRFIEVADKVDVQWHPENASMTYRKKNKYIFDAAASKGTLDDNIVTINSLAVSLSAKAKHWSPLRRRVIDIGLRIYREHLVVKKTVNELLFAGYEDLLLNVASVIPSSIIDVELPFDRFGYTYPRNESANVNGVFNIYTGADDIRKFGQLHSWNYKETTEYFSAECAKVHGSPGEFQPPHLEKYKPIEYFLSDLCRAVKMDYVRVENVQGVEGYRYESGLRFIDNGTLYPENVCHCNGRCVPSGVLNVSSCWFGAPLFLSYPHFYAADPYYLRQVEGLKPLREKHELYMVLEPRTGLMLEMVGRLQTNMFLEPISDFSMFRHNRTMFFPLFWCEGKIRVTPALANEFKLLPRLILTGQIFGGVCVLIGVALLAWLPLAAHARQHVLQQIKISNLEHEPHRIVGKQISTHVEIAPFLIRTMQENARMLQRADTTISAISLNSSETDAEDSRSLTQSSS